MLDGVIEAKRDGPAEDAEAEDEAWALESGALMLPEVEEGDVGVGAG